VIDRLACGHEGASGNGCHHYPTAHCGGGDRDALRHLGT
jgi:hypothetical protein